MGGGGYYCFLFSPVLFRGVASHRHSLIFQQLGHGVFHLFFCNKCPIYPPDWEVKNNELDRVRVLYSRLLELTMHVKVGGGGLIMMFLSLLFKCFVSRVGHKLSNFTPPPPLRFGFPSPPSRHPTKKPSAHVPSSKRWEEIFFFVCFLSEICL